MHPVFESLRSYAEYKKWGWTDDLTALALDVEEDWEEVEGILWHYQMRGFQEVFAALLFHNQKWAGFKVYGLHPHYWPVVVNGIYFPHYRVHHNRYGFVEVDDEI